VKQMVQKHTNCHSLTTSLQYFITSGVSCSRKKDFT